MHQHRVCGEAETPWSTAHKRVSDERAYATAAILSQQNASLRIRQQHLFQDDTKYFEELKLTNACASVIVVVDRWKVGEQERSRTQK